MRLGETPVHIPNTMVKTQAAHGTMLETAWESRWLPDSFKKITRESVLYRTDTSEWVEIKAKPVTQPEKEGAVEGEASDWGEVVTR